MFCRQMTFYLVYPVFYLIGKMPRGFQVGVAHMLHFLIYRVAHYRVSVVRDNLKKAFAEKSDAELLDIERKFYRQLSDVFVETIVMASISEKRLRERMEFINADQIEAFTASRSWICAMAHYGSWEYTTSWGVHSKHDHTLAVYRPLVNKGFDCYYRQTRARFGVQPVAMEGVGRELFKLHKKGLNTVIALIADQTPPPSVENWIEFLGRPTSFFEGMERIAVKFSMPIAFLHIDKFDKGQYKGWFEVIYDGTEKLPDGEITRRYAARLEAMIRSRPELWMWSHRRWKWQPKEVANQTQAPL